MAIATLKDMIDHLLRTAVLRENAGAPYAEREREIVTGAILEAYRDIPKQKVDGWSYYQRQLLITTHASQTIGTVTYTHATREVTLAGATWPEDARYGDVVIAGVRYEVDQRKSSSVITLPSSNNPGANIAAGTAYTWCRGRYPLGGNFRISQLSTQSCSPLAYVYPTSWDTYRQSWSGAGTPQCYTIRGHRQWPAQMVVEFWPPPSTVQRYEANGELEPRPMKMRAGGPEYVAGTVTIAAGSDEVVGDGTAFTQDFIGSVMRLPAPDQIAKLPTGQVGANPYHHEKIVISVTDGTHLKLHETVAEDYEDSKYTLGDPVDVEPGSMQTYFERLCEARYAIIARDKDAEGRLDNSREVRRLHALMEAQAADSRVRDTIIVTDELQPWMCYGIFRNAW